MLTAQQVDTIFQNINTEAPDKWKAGIQTVLLDQAKTIQILATEIGRLRKQLNLVAPAVAQIVQGMTAAAAAAGAAPEGAEAAPDDVVSSAPPPPTGVPTVGNDGLPLSPEEMANEAMMNAATSPDAQAAAQPQAPQGQPRSRPMQPQGQPRRARPQQSPARQRLQPVPPQGGNSPGGTPTTVDQDELEAQMNAAAGPRPE